MKSDSVIFLEYFKKTLKANNFASDYFRLAIQGIT